VGDRELEEEEDLEEEEEGKGDCGSGRGAWGRGSGMPCVVGRKGERVGSGRSGRWLEPGDWGLHTGGGCDVVGGVRVGVSCPIGWENY